MNIEEPISHEHVRYAFDKLYQSVRALTYASTQPLPVNTDRVNLLARYKGPVCRFCGLVGHQTNHIDEATACKTAILCVIGFWEDTVDCIRVLYKAHRDFTVAVQKSEPTYDMALVGGDIYTVIVNHLVRNYITFQRHIARILPKVVYLLDAASLQRLEECSQLVNGFLLNGFTSE